MGWHWETYLDQPTWLTNMLIEMMAARGRKNERDSKQRS